MSDTISPTSNPRSLAGLMKVSGDEPAIWSSADLGAILRHQLAAPLEYDLRTLAPGGEQTITNLAATITTGLRPRSFGDLIRHPTPPLELLNLMKDFARSGRDSGTIPPEVGTVLYYAAIGVGVLRHNTRITKLDEGSLRKGIEWSMAQPWVDENLKTIFAESLSGSLAPVLGGEG